MPRICLVVPVLLVLMPRTLPAFTLQLDSTAFAVTPMFSDVTEFSIRVEVDAALAPGRYENPPLDAVSYSVTGPLAPGNPSGQGHVALS
ncbi:MAG: hypothetical protein KJO38_06875, partial [Gammaproteobacteria bacterium]|nr:hypothetical protein [Gammaproteobacteria bacterium]